MSANDRNEYYDKSNAAADQQEAPDSNEGELTQDELNNVSGGRFFDKSDAGEAQRRDDKGDHAFRRRDTNDPDEAAREPSASTLSVRNR